MSKKGFYVAVIFGAVLVAGTGNAVRSDEIDLSKKLTEEQIEAWFNDDSEGRALAVNEGTLAFFSEVPDKPVHYIHNTFIIDKASLSTGWVVLEQCHQNLDAVPDSQIVYRYQRMKNLQVKSNGGIEQAWVDGNSIQLRNTTKGAQICIRANVGILYTLVGGGFIIKNGPYHRKFLDGYYPMKITLKIQFPENLLKFKSISPNIQPGLSMIEKKGAIEVNALFEGELTTEIRFTAEKN